jgi:hypothetical protein
MRRPILPAFLPRAVLSSALLLSALQCASGEATAAGAPASAPGAPQFVQANAVPTATLDNCRGGYDSLPGLAVTLGIERIVMVNGNVLERSAMQFGDLARLTTGAGQVLLTGRSPLQGTFLQNSLNNQTLQSVAIIHASVDARGAIQAMHFQSTLAHAFTLSLSGR